MTQHSSSLRERGLPKSQEILNGLDGSEQELVAAANKARITGLTEYFVKDNVRFAVRQKGIGNRVWVVGSRGRNSVLFAG